MRRATAAGMLAAICACAPATKPDDERAKAALHALFATTAMTSGELQVRRANQPFWEHSGIGTTFMSGDWARTGKGSSARIELLLGGRIELEESAVVVVERTDEPAPADGGVVGQEPLVGLEAGALKGRIDQAGRSVSIRGGDGTRARLTSQTVGAAMEYRLSRGKRGTAVAIHRGRALLAIRGTERSLRAGEGAELTADRAGEVFQLVSAPEPLSPGHEAHLPFDGQQIDLHWRAAARGVEPQGYRVQVSRETAFTELLLVSDIAEDRVQFQPPGPGSYHWRVSGLDADGRYGEFSATSSFQLVPPPSRDHLLAPADGTSVQLKMDNPLTFSWDVADGVEEYRLRISRGTDLGSAAVVDLRTRNTEADVDRLAPGTYTWGVFSAGSDQAPLFLKARRLVVLGGPRERLDVPKAIRNWGE